MSQQEVLSMLLKLRDESLTAQEAAARARQRYDQAAFDIADAIRAELGHKAAVAFVHDGWCIVLRDTEHPGVRDNPWQFVRLQPDAG